MLIADHLRKISLSSATLMACLLIWADLVFILIHCVNVLTIKSELWDIERDRSYAEIYQYIKLFWIISLMLYLFITTKTFNFLSWAVVFSYLMIDDAFSIHEVFGRHIASYYNFSPLANIRPIDFGELAVSVMAGTFLLCLLAISYLKGSAIAKKISLDLLILVIVLACFGVLLDLAHVAIKLGVMFSAGLGVLEDGGEMVIVSITFWYVFCLALRKGNPESYLHEIKSIYK